VRPGPQGPVAVHWTPAPCTHGHAGKGVSHTLSACGGPHRALAPHGLPGLQQVAVLAKHALTQSMICSCTGASVQYSTVQYSTVTASQVVIHNLLHCGVQ